MMTSKERVLAALKLQKPDRVPFMELGIDHEIGVQLLGKEEYTPGELAECLCLDGIGTPFYPRIYTERHTNEDGRSYITGGLLKTRKDLDMIKLDDPSDPKLYDGVKRFVEQYGDRYAIFGATNIGLDPLLLSMGFDGFAYALADDLKLIEKILDIYTDWAAETVMHLQEAGMDIVWFTDDIAFNTSLMFSPAFFREVAVPRLQKVMRNVKVPSMYHSDGNIMAVMDDLINLGFNGIHPMEPGAVDIVEVKKQFGHKVCLVGNIDLRHTLVNGTVEEVEQEVRDRIEKVGYNGGYILSSANSLAKYCKVENVLAMRDAVLKYGAL